MDYRKFLARREEVVLPYLGGRDVTGPSRSALVSEPVEPGWWTFAIEGRRATPIARAEPPAGVIERLPAVHGHAWSGWLALPDASAEPLCLVPDDEPPRFSPCVARRWHSGDLLFERLEFEEDAEELVRRALEDGRTLAGMKGVPASLRAAFAFAVAADVSRVLGIPAVPLELRAAAGDIAEAGWPAAERALRRLVEERAAAERSFQRERAARERVVAPVARLAPARRRPVSLEEDVDRAEHALRVANAQLLDFRSRGGGRLELTWRIRGLRIMTIVESGSLRVVSAGLCLSGEDSALTLDSLPGVVTQAIAEERLVLMHGSVGDWDE